MRSDMMRSRLQAAVLVCATALLLAIVAVRAQDPGAAGGRGRQRQEPAAGAGQGAPNGPGQGRGRGPQAAPPSPLLDGDFTIRPPWANSNDLIIDLHAPQGTVHRFLMKSEDSKIYKGVSRAKPGEVVPYERPVAVYVPAQYVPGTEAPFIVVQDGYNPKYSMTVPTILDNLIAQKKVPPMIAVMVQHGGGDGPGS